MVSMKTRFTTDFKKGFWTAMYEYLIITMPIGIYVFLEASHEADWTYLYETAEWAIATIFLSFIGISRYLMAIRRSDKAIFEPILGIIGILMLTIIIASTLNAKISIDSESVDHGAVIFRIILFGFTSILFFILIIGTRTLRKDSHV